MSYRHYDSEVVNFEKFNNSHSKRKGSSRRAKRKKNWRNRLNKLQALIVERTLQRGDGVISSANFKNAVDILCKWLGRRSNKLAITEAFRELVDSKIFREDRWGQFHLMAG